MGEDKALLNFGNPPQSLWQRQLQLLGSLQPDQLLLSHNADQEFAVPGGVEMVVDTRADCGPLGGVVSLLRRSSCERLLVLAVDLPYVTAEFLRQMVDADAAGLVLQDPDSGRLEPVVAIYNHGCLAIAEECLRRGDLAMRHFVSSCVAAGDLEIRTIEEAERGLLKNLNRPEDLH
jgi:molybdopterin-guanine dinucleotide biosynthesis protein A